MNVNLPLPSLRSNKQSRECIKSNITNNKSISIEEREEKLEKYTSYLIKKINQEKNKLDNLTLDKYMNYQSNNSIGLSNSIKFKTQTKRKVYSNNLLNFEGNKKVNLEDNLKYKDNLNNPSFGNNFIQKYSGKQYKSNKPKYNNKFKLNYISKTLKGSLFSFNINKDHDDRKYFSSLNTKYAQVAKLKLKWKTIKFLLDHNKECLDRLIKFQENLLSKSKTSLSKIDFTKMMITNGITSDINLINKLFWVFDENGDGDLKYSEIAFGIEMFRDSSTEQKLKLFFDLCDEDRSGTISKTEFINLFKKNLINSDEKMGMKVVIEKIFSSATGNEYNNEITFEQLKKGCAKHKEMYNIIDKNLNALKSIDHIIDNDIKNDIMSFNPDANDQLRIKLLNQRVVFIPKRDDKFAGLIDNMIRINERRGELKNIKDEMKESFIEDEDSID